MVLTRTVTSSSIGVNILKNKTNHSSTQRTVIGIPIYIYSEYLEYLEFQFLSSSSTRFNEFLYIDSFRFKTAPTTPTSCNRMKSWEAWRNHNNIWGYQTNVSKKNHPNQSFLIDVSFGFVSFGCDIILFFQVLNQILLNMFLLIMFHEDQIFEMNLHVLTKEQTKGTSYNNTNNHL